jgi:hypothetical protein
MFIIGCELSADRPRSFRNWYPSLFNSIDCAARGLSKGVSIGGCSSLLTIYLGSFGVTIWCPADAVTQTFICPSICDLSGPSDSEKQELHAAEEDVDSQPNSNVSSSQPAQLLLQIALQRVSDSSEAVWFFVSCTTVVNQEEIRVIVKQGALGVDWRLDLDCHCTYSTGSVGVVASYCLC